ncbi:hypothetical protein CKK34_6064 [Yarrowia sp. E02]|nr:hypothetical protein CKK34_6064 [Yarrowia sp. E02]
MASTVTREMYMNIVSHMCQATNSQVTNYWFHTFTGRYKYLFDNDYAIDKILSDVLPWDYYKMEVWEVDGGEIHLESSPLATKMRWLRMFLPLTHTVRLRILEMPFHEGLEEFIAECFLNDVLVLHKSRTVVVETAGGAVAKAEDVIAAIKPELAVTSPSRDSNNYFDNQASDADTSDDTEDTPENAVTPDTGDTPETADTDDTPETGDTDDTITEFPAVTSSTSEVTPTDELSAMCKGFSQKDLPGDVLKLLEHALEERNKLLLKVVSLEMDLKVAKGQT